LKGKKIGVEIGFVDHLLLLNGLKKAGLKESDITLVNVLTHQAAQTLASGQVDAVAAWQPNSGQALKLVPGSVRVYSSADEPGLIYDMLAVSPSSLEKRKADWEKVVKVWYKIVEYINNSGTQDDAVKIMAARVGIKAEEYKPLLAGTKLLTLEETKEVMKKSEGFKSVYGSSKIVDKFQVDNKVYDTPQNVEKYIYPDIINGMK
jgi:NitT/TauT family transport system substrate-binding protein